MGLYLDTTSRSDSGMCPRTIDVNGNMRNAARVVMHRLLTDSGPTCRIMKGGRVCRVPPDFIARAKSPVTLANAGPPHMRGRRVPNFNLTDMSMASQTRVPSSDRPARMAMNNGPMDQWTNLQIAQLLARLPEPCATASHLHVSTAAAKFPKRCFCQNGIPHSRTSLPPSSGPFRRRPRCRIRRQQGD